MNDTSVLQTSQSRVAGFGVTDLHDVFQTIVSQADIAGSKPYP
ncbi:hypothetical protein [Novipirellula caenicola]|uniref:Uncharacterized protein n=1 Tax=Novipirellula caenicola TaxID=1536901 RepID=A0ABP9VMJ9_9BACT